jgi:Na+-translocating ferredoxin:NAD+ oxidoreductase subunit C
MIKRSFFSLAKPKLTCPVLKHEPGDLVEIPLPAKAHVFLDRSFAGSNGLPIRPGDKVKTGQRIGLGGDGGEYFVSPVTGVISRISSIKGYMGRSLTSVSIDVAKDDVWDDEFGGSGGMLPKEKIGRFLSSLPGQPDFSSVVGFHPPIKTIVIYGIDKDLLVSTNQYVVRTRLEDLIKGVGVLKQICGECRVVLFVPSGLALQAERTGVEVRALPPAYPDLLPKVLMHRFFGKEVPAGSRCEELGVGFLSAEAVANLGAAFAGGRIPVHKMLTVIRKDQSVVNVRARIGTPVQEILNALKIETRSGDRLILGGPMTGLSVYSEETPVLAGTDALMIQDASQAARFSDTHCVNCGECVRVCPAKMPVNMLIRVLENQMYEEAVQTYDLLSCVECGLCSFVCTARIPIFHYVMLGKYEYDRMKSAEGSNG